MPPAFHKDDPVKLHRLIHEARLSAPEWPLSVVKESMTNDRNGVGCRMSAFSISLQEPDWRLPAPVPQHDLAAKQQLLKSIAYAARKKLLPLS